MKPILYISTNLMWSGSEELWARSAKMFAEQGYKVAFATKYEHPELRNIHAPHVNFASPPRSKSLTKRITRRLSGLFLPKKPVLQAFIKQIDPQLVVISQGHTYQAIKEMQYCSSIGVPYVTVSQLVADIFIWGFVDDQLPVIQQAFLRAKRNYFVSHHNLRVHNTMLGLDLPNADVIYNPCKIPDQEVPEFPEAQNQYHLGLVGRIDCWHKGYDFLLQIARKEKWQKRPIQFNLYGSGPYLEYMKGIVSRWNLSNIVFKGHSNNVSQVWKENQILFMPSRMEGQALALIEAAYCQRAAIVTNVGGAAELIEEGLSGFIADEPTVASIDAALERAWEQRDRWKELGLNAAASLKAKYPADAVAYFNGKISEQLQ